MARQSGRFGGRLLLISLEYLPPHFSGNGVYAEQVVSALRKRWDVKVITAYFGGALAEYVIPVPMSTRISARENNVEFALRSLRILDELEDFNPEVVIGVDWHSALPSLALKKKAGCPLLWMPFRVFSHSSDSLVVRKLEKMVARETDAIIALSKADAMLIEKFFDRKASCILHPPLTLRRRGSSQVTVSRVSPEKNIEQLIKAMPKITDALSLIIAGAVTDKGYMAKLKALAENLGVEKRIVFAGRVSREKLPEMYSKAMIYVSPTKYEPFGLSIIEAAYHGLPIVVDSSGLVGAGALFTHGKDCMKVNMDNEDELAEAVNVLFESPDMARELGEKAVKVAEKLTINAFEEKINNFILGVINREEHGMERC
jgi:glycosyltransferase involved in cell wall biosynthesis